MKSTTRKCNATENTPPTVPFRQRVEPGDWLLVTRGPLAGTWLKLVQSRRFEGQTVLMLEAGEKPTDGAAVCVPSEWCSAVPRLAWWRRLKLYAVARLARWLTAVLHREAVLRERERIEEQRASYLDLAAENAELRIELVTLRAKARHGEREQGSRQII